MNKKRRIFIACVISDKLQNIINNWRTRFADFPVRWIPLDHLHVTLVPPWYEQHVEKIISLLQSIQLPVRQFSIKFDNVTLGPDMEHPRLIWATGVMPEDLILLKTSLANILKRKEEKRTPLLHLTLARLNKKQLLMFPKKDFSEIVSWEEQIISFSVMESHLKRTGAVYETLVKISL